VPDPSVIGPVAEAYLADEPGLHPVMPSARGNGPAIEGRRGTLERLELFPQALEPRLVEAGADLGDIDEARAVVHPPFVQSNVQRAEVAARTLGIGVTSDDELSAALALDLDPVTRAAARVGAARPLGHDPLEARLGSRLQEGLPVLHHVVDVVHGLEGRHEHPETF